MDANKSQETNKEFVNTLKNSNQNNITDDDNNLLQKELDINSVLFLTPISPITYKIQARTVEKVIHHLHGITTSSEVIGVKTLDQVNISEGIFFGSVTLVHEDKSTIDITKISKGQAKEIKEFYEKVVDFQRRNVVNVTGD